MRDRGSDDTRWEMAAEGKGQRSRSTDSETMLTCPCHAAHKDLGQRGAPSKTHVAYEERAADRNGPAGRDLSSGREVGE